MRMHQVRVYPSKEKLKKEDQLAYQFAAMASDPVEVEAAVTEMIINRMIDNASVAMASVSRTPVANARSQAVCHPRANGATVFGLPLTTRVSCEWAAWANGTAVRELDYHDTFLAADYSHPADNIPPILAVAQQKGCDGRQLIRGIATGYEIQVNLVKAICLHKYKKDHIAHLGPSVAAGIGTMLGLPTETIYQAVQQAVHVCFTTRQSRKGEISSWKAYAPAHAGKLGIEAVDRCMRGEKAPSPIYEGEDSVIAWMLDGPKGSYAVPMPEKGEAKRAILETYTKEHSAEYQAQALIDLAFRMREKITNWADVEKIILHTSHHTHYVIGTGSGDPQKMDPHASRETLDHSIMYILAVALLTGRWHHVDSYEPKLAQDPQTVALWHKIETVEDPKWTAAYHENDPHKKAFGGRVEIRLKGGKTVVDEMAFANAHPYGAKPFARPDYIRKFKMLTDSIISPKESARFLDLVQRLPELKASEIQALSVCLDPGAISFSKPDERGIF